MALRLFLIILLLLNFTGVAQATSYVDDANCQGAWLFTEGSGTTVADSSQNSNTGNFKGAGEPAWDAVNVPAAYTTYSVAYDGSDDVISCGTDASLDFTGDHSIVGWIRLRAAPWRGAILFRMQLSGSYYGYNFVWNQDTTGNMSYYNNGSGWRQASTDLSYITWYHVAVVVDVNVGGTFYLNGVSDGTWSDTTSAPTTNATAAQLGREGAAPTLGGNETEIGAFNRILNSTEINDILDNGLKPAAPPTGYGQVI